METRQSLFGAPAAVVNKSKSDGILDVLVDMKTESEMGDLCKAENNARHNFSMLSCPWSQGSVSAGSPVCPDLVSTGQSLFGAPAAAMYKARSDGILDVLVDI